MTISTQKKDFQDPTSSSFFSEQLNVDTLYFEARQNDWYQSAGIEEALEFTETYLENRRVVTFGGSMAGYAAIAFSGKLNAQCFIAAAPQFSLHHEFVNEISETRWPFMYDKFRYDFIRTRYFEFSKGVLFYDNLNDLERKHVEAIANFVDCETILVPGSNHFPWKEMKDAGVKITEIIAEVLANIDKPNGLTLAASKINHRYRNGMK